MTKILIVEPYFGGSHKQLIEFLMKILDPEDYHLITMTPKKWPWRARCSALCIAEKLPDLSNFNTLFCSSVLNLSELVGVCPYIANLRKIVYFHENQLVYPRQEVKDRDFQYGYNQIMTCLSADFVVFNSDYNKDSFLKNINSFLKLMPDFRPVNLPERIAPKCSVIYFPLDFTLFNSSDLIKKVESRRDTGKLLHIVWPHRWEFDKNPELMFKTLFKLSDRDIPFKVSVLGESFTEKPKIFEEAFSKLGPHLNHFGFVESKNQYYEILLDADVVLSTADHEFFGVSIAEAVKCGCLPLLPNKLVYPELYPSEVLYDTDEDLLITLQQYCLHPQLVTTKLNLLQFKVEKVDCDNLKDLYLDLLKPQVM